MHPTSPYAAVFAVALAALLSPAAGAQVMYSNTFDGGPGGDTGAWNPTFNTFSGGIGWAFDPTPGGNAHSGTIMLNFNNGTNYSSTTGAVGGFARSPLHDLSASVGPVLKFWCRYDTETERGAAAMNQHDVRDITIYTAANAPVALFQFLHASGDGNSYAGFNGLITGKQTCGASGVWHQHTVVLDPRWGPVRVEFGFSANDTAGSPNANNNHAGWFIDDYELFDTGIPLPLPAPAPEGDGGKKGGCLHSSGPGAGGLLVALAAFLAGMRRACRPH